jgi:hypothetical protein
VDLSTRRFIHVLFWAKSSQHLYFYGKRMKKLYKRSAINFVIGFAGVVLSTGTTITAQAQTPAVASPGIASKLIIRGDVQGLLGLQMVDLRSQRRNDVLVVQAEVVNTDLKDIRLYYRFRWLDAGGMQVGDGEGWKPLVFMGKQNQLLRGTAYGPQATDFLIEMSAEQR